MNSLFTPATLLKRILFSNPESITRARTRRQSSPRERLCRAIIEALETRTLLSGDHLVFAVDPTDTVAGQSISSITVDVENGGDTVDAGSSALVTFSINSGPDGSAGTLHFAVQAQNGVATLTGLAFTEAGTYTLAATATAITGAVSTSFDITPDAASQLAITAGPVSTTAGQTLSGITVAVEDQFGNVVTSDSSTVTISTASGSGVLGGTTSEAASSGIATFSDLSYTKADTYTLAVSDDSLAGATSGSFTISAAGANKLAFITPPAGTTAGQTLSGVDVAVEDTYGNIITNSTAPIMLALASGSGTLLGTTTQDAAAGVAGFGDLSLDVADTYTVTASSNGVADATSGSFTINPAGAAKMVFSQEPGSVDAGNLGSISVSIEDQFGNVITTDSATSITLSVASGSGSLGGTSTATVSDGVATFGGLSIHKADTYTLGASATGLPGATSTGFTISPDSASQLAITQQIASTTAGATLSSLVISVEDQYGNIVTANNSDVTIAIASGSGTLNGTATVAADEGVATFNTLSIDQAGTFTLAGTDGALSTVTGGSFVISPAAPAALVFTTGPAGTSAGNLAGITVSVEDQYGNIVTSNSSAITVAVATGSGTLLGNTTVSAVNGVATFSGLAIHTADSYTLKAMASGFSATTSGSFTISPSSASKLAFTEQPASMTAGNLLTGIDVSVEDQYGNVVTSSSASVTFTVTGGGNTFNFNITASSGVAALTSIYLVKAGAYGVHASSSGITAANSNTIMVDPDAPYQLVLTQDTNSTTAGQTLAAPTVEVEDQFGNVVTTDSSDVTVSVESGAGTLQGLTTVAANDGVATFNGLSLLKADTYTLEFSDADLVTASSGSFNISPAAAHQLAITQQPTDTMAGQPISGIKVTVEDQYGNPIMTDSSNVTLALTTDSGTLQGTATEGASSGVATFSDLSIDQAGTYTLAASDGELSGDTTTSFAITPAGANQLVILDGPTDGAAGGLGTLEVGVEDQYGNIVTGDSSDVTFAVHSGSGMLLGTAMEPADHGIATFSDLAIHTPDTYTLKATDGVLTPDTSGLFTISPAAPSKLVITQDTSSQTAGQDLSGLQVSVEDQYGNVVTSDSSNITVSIATGSGTLLGTTTASASSGVATFSTLKIDKADDYTLSVSESGLTGATTASFTISPDIASKLAITQGPTTTVAGAPIADIDVTVEDQFGNTVTSNSSNVTLAIATGTGVLNGTTTVAASSGVADISGLSIDQTGTFTLAATDGILGAATSSSFTITSGTASQLAIAQGPVSGTVGTLTSMTVDVEDQFGNIVTGDSSTVTIGIATGTGSLGGTRSVVAVGGVATFSNLMITTPGPFTLSATDNVVAGATTGSFTLNVGSASQLAYTQQPADAIAGQPLATITVSVEDQYGNVVTTDHSTVTLGINANGTDLTLIAGASSGVASFGGAAINITGSYKFKATDGALPSVLSSSFAITPAAASQVVITQEPTSGAAGTLHSVVVSVEDQYGNVVTTDSSNVTLAMDTGGGNLGGTDTVAAIDGVATLSAMTITTPGTFTLAATDGVLGAATSSSFSITPAAAAKLVITQDTSSQTAGQNLSSLQVSVEDQYGNVVTTDSSNVTVAIATGSGTLLGTTTASAASGVVSFSNLKIDQAGTYTLSVSESGLTGATTGSFTISPDLASKLVITQGPTTTVAGQPISTVDVTVEDQFGNTVTSNSSNVTLAIATGTGVLNGTTTVPASAGVAAFTGLSIDQAGSFTLGASENGLAGDTSGSFSITPTTASKLVITQAPQAGAAGSLNSVVVSVEDQYGNVVTGDTSTVTLSAASGPGELLGTTSVPVSAGIATFNTLAIHIGGTYTLAAADGDLTGDTSADFAITPAPASKLVIMAAPVSTIAGDTLGTTTVDVEDQFGNIVSNDTSSVTIAIHTGSGTLLGTQTVTADDGVAEFSDLAIDQAGTFTLAVSDGELAGADTESFVISPAAASKLVIATAPVSTTAGDTLATTTVDVEDPFGNIIGNDTSSVTIAIHTGSGTLLGTETVTADSGVATFSDLVLDQAGTFTLAVSDGELAGADTGSFTVSPAAASKLAITQDTQSQTAGGTLSSLEVSVEDQYGNVVTSNSSLVTVAIDSGAGTLLGTKSQAADEGVATFSDLSLDQAGTFTLAVSASELAGADTGSFTISPADATQLVITQQPSDTVAGQPISNVEVTVEDQYGNVVTGDTEITLAINTGTGVLNGTTPVATDGGVADFGDLSIDQAGTITLVATDGDLPPATTDSFVITPDIASQLVIINGPGDTVAGQTMGEIDVAVEDQFGNIETGATADAMAILSDDSVQVNGTTDVNISNGIAAFNDLSIDTAGNYSFDFAYDGPLSDVGSDNFNITPAAPSQLAFTQEPESGVTGSLGTVSVSVEDTFGNLETSSTASITIAAAGGSGKLTGTASEPAIGGVATFSNLAISKTGSYTLSASSSGLAGATTDSFVLGAKLVFQHQPGTTIAGNTVGNPLNVLVENASGKTVTTDDSEVTIDIFSGPNDAVLNGTETVSAVNGVASFTDLSLDTAGSYKLVVSDGSMPNTVSSAFTVVPAAPTQMVLLQGTPDSVTAGAKMSAVKVELLDQFNNVATNYHTHVVLTLDDAPDGGAILGTASVAPVNGIATFNTLSFHVAGSYTINAASGGLTIDTSGFTVTPGAAKKLAFNQQPTGTGTATDLSPDISVDVEDAYGNLISSSASISLSLSSGPSGTAFTRTVAASSGEAVFDALTFAKAGKYRVKATSHGLTTATSVTFTITA